MSQPLISVVMSVFNGERYVDQSIKSILNQTYRNIELIIINDGSSDGSLEIINKNSLMDGRIVIIDRENKGLPFSLNEGINVAQGEYIARMDADDICTPDRLEKQLDYIIKNGLDLVYSDTILIEDNGGEVCRSYRPKSMNKVLLNLERHNFIPHPTVLIKKKVFDEFGGYNLSYRTGQDTELWIRLRGEIKFGYLDEPLLFYRLNSASIRAEGKSNYYFKLANTAIWNNKKSRSLKYFKNLSMREKIIICIKLMLPNAFYHRNLI